MINIKFKNTRERVHPVTRKHSFLSPKCEANNNSQIHRYGVFAKEDIKRGELIERYGRGTS